MEGFYISTITDDIFSRIQGRSYPENCTVSRDELRYVHIRHYGFEGEIRDGELIVNAAIAQDVLEIFEELYAIKYQIEKVRLIDEYGADDERSMEDNNSSCFNYRTIAESNTLSNHAYGRAIDINPFYNPYVYTRSDGSLFLQPKGSDRYVDRTVDAACIIRNGDACYNIFAKHGFTWGGDWNTKKDYQHFEKTE
ncbi:MAG: M15 family metallopeptidase [Lachnospiraceae bacterium]|nr:M15 family metallopeptidase [Lachnospiraceae bacterium]